MRSWIPILLLAGCPSEPEPVRYTVVRGDTLGEIATTHGVTVDDLRTWNGLEGDLIEVGQVLEIRHGSTPAPPPSPAASRRRATPSPPSAPPADAWVLPPEQPCLPPPQVDAEGDGFTTLGSQGLEPGAVKAVTDAFVPRTISCAPEGWQGRGSLVVDLTVACTGRVQGVEVVSDGGLPAPMVSCLRERLRYAPFPAHALPDGDRVRVPLHFAYEPAASP